MVDLMGSKPSGMVDSTGIHIKNTINVIMKDLVEEDRKEVERELKEEMAEIQRRKLACFQKAHNGVVKKALRNWYTWSMYLWLANMALI
jgi:hypothetical protein